MLKNKLLTIIIYVGIVFLFGACSAKEPIKSNQYEYKPVAFEKTSGPYPHRYTSVRSFMNHEYPKK